ncbi:microtubule-associated protein futsch, partial [Asbolus verrucosus]
MLQITEDTPPDMLAGAMDLTVHLPTGRSVKMSVERSTPMMDLLVQITTNHHLQLSGYTLQALGMAPSTEHNDTILPYKPNTPIGALDTQHIKVVPKSRTIPVPKNVPAGHQPFESTFRLKVHLPRNQLYVTRVSQSVHLEDIMKKVCEEKNLDPLKYEFRHPGNLDEVLDPKLTLSDYTITEIYLVLKGTGGLNQAFSSSDIMALRKEEERKQMHNKTGGGVFNLIFRRGKSSTGSLSSENRSISPTHSDDSRSVTPPGVQQQIITPPQSDSLTEKPKPPQRKRRPAPKPPQDKPPSTIETKKTDTGLTICHSRNSSDSSGYHEASILSDNCNTSLPRRPKSTIINEETQKSLSGQHSQSTSNLSKMSAHSKSTSSLAFPNRKKKTAPPPPPPVLKPASSETTFEEPSPVVASQPPIVAQGQDSVVNNNTNPIPTSRNRTKIAPSPRPQSIISLTSEDSFEEKKAEAVKNENKITLNETVGESIAKANNDKNTVNEGVTREGNNQVEEKTVQTDLVDETRIQKIEEKEESAPKSNDKIEEEAVQINLIEKVRPQKTEKKEEIAPESNGKMSNQTTAEEKTFKHDEMSDENKKKAEINKDMDTDLKQKASKLTQLQKQNVTAVFNTTTFTTASTGEDVKPPEVVAFYPKTQKKEHRYSKSIFDSYTRKRGFQIGSSLLDLHSDEEANQKRNSSGLSTPNSVASALNAFDFVDEIEGLDVEMFTGSLSKKSRNKNVILNQLHGMHEFESFRKHPSSGSLRSVSSLPGFIGSNMKKWNNIEELDDISLHSYSGQTESAASATNTSQLTPLDSLASIQSLPASSLESKPKEVEETTIPINVETKHPEVNEPQKDNELETDWQYQLPSPPKAFRDSSPVAFADTNQESIADSVVTSPELFEKLKVVKDIQSEKETASDITSVMSEEEKPILNKLSLENLEKRKSLVYNRELATSLKMPEEDRKDETFSSSLTKFEKTYDEVRRSSPKEVVSMKSTLPNFKITTYDNPKQKLDIFEDDTISSNTDRGSKRNSFVEPSPTLQKNYMGRSMENISFRKNSSDDEFKKRNDYKFYRPPMPKTQLHVFRSESFSKEPTWIPSKPVTRSKSQVALNKYKDNKNLSQIDDDNLTKSNSLFDVSGLQSLGVMRQIQNKLNTPNNSTEQLDREETSYQEQPEIKSEVQNRTEEKPTVKTYQYRVPSINMGTWSERPKIPVNVKEDPDYKFGVKDTNHSKLIVNTVNNDIRSHNSIEVRNKMAPPTSYSNGVNLRVGSDNNNRNVSIKVNGSEPISGQNTGNVVIKIGGLNQTSNKAVFRKPLGNVNENNQRPHSIAFGSDFDISRVPIVRSVEFKKPYKDFQNNNTSVTQIYQSNNNNNFKSNTLNRNSYNSTTETPVNSTETSKKYSTETLPIKPHVEPKPVFRVNSYLQNVSAPVVRGFRNINETNRMSWSQPHSFSTLPMKTATKDFSANKSVPFSQSNLRRTESTKIEKTVPPPAPIMPKVVNTSTVKTRDNCGDPKEQLLQAIRDFGGKKGLRAVKA